MPLSLSLSELRSLPSLPLYRVALRTVGTDEKHEAYPEEGKGRTAVDGAVSDLGLLRQVIGGLDGRDHAFDSEEGRQVGRVGGDDDEREEPPHSADDARRHGSRVDVAALLHQRADGEPERVGEGEDVFEDGAVRIARVRIVPLVRAEPRQHVHHQTHHLQQQQPTASDRQIQIAQFDLHRH